MSRSIEEIQEALRLVRGSAEYSARGGSKAVREEAIMLGGIVADAIDELAALRESDAALRASVETLTQQFQQAEGARILAAGLEEQVQALTEGRSEDEAMLAAQQRKVFSLIGELDAAKADAARAELRARDAVAALARIAPFLSKGEPYGAERHSAHRMAMWGVEQFLAAATDSDARLREVMGRCVDAAVDATMTALPACADCGSRRDKAYERIDPIAIVDEVLRGGA